MIKDKTSWCLGYLKGMEAQRQMYIDEFVKKLKIIKKQESYVDILCSLNWFIDDYEGKIK